jgi:thiamine kinase-like enzyme
MPLSLEQALQRVPAWQGQSNLKSSFLSGGITNLNYRVETGDGSFVLRIGGEDSELLGITREAEYAAHSAAAQIGLAPEVLYFIRPEGYLVTRFIQGRPIPPEEIRQPATIRRIVGTMHRYHALPPIAWTFSPFRTVETYAETARGHDVALPRPFEGWLADLRSIESTLAAHPSPPRLCHNDLLNANFLDDGELRILDWEYAGMGDVEFDLANLSVHHEFRDEHDQILLTEYFAEAATPARLARLRLLKIASDFREAMWGMVQAGISKLDFDFRGYADRHFRRMAARTQAPTFRQWLEEARG